MGKLIYSAIASLDGYIEDADGDFDWAAPDEDVHAFINDLMRPVGTHLYGRRTYEVMVVWETDPSLAAQSPLLADFAQIWQEAEKVVYSTTLDTASTERTRIEPAFEPDAVRELKESATRDLLVGGPDLGAQAFEAGLVDVCHLFLVPILVGEGKPALPHGVRLDLELLEERSFRSGFVHLHYGVKA